MSLPRTIPGLRKYDLDIVAGELYEVWLREAWEEPKSIVTIERRSMPTYETWDILLEDELLTVHSACIFLPGTATPPMEP